MKVSCAFVFRAEASWIFVTLRNESVRTVGGENPTELILDTRDVGISCFHMQLILETQQSNPGCSLLVAPVIRPHKHSNTHST